MPTPSLGRQAHIEQTDVTLAETGTGCFELERGSTEY